MNPSLEPTDDELFGFALGELPPERATALEQWSQAPEHQARLAEVRALVTTLERAPSAVDLVVAIDARIDQRMRRRRREVTVGGVMLLAAAACLVAWWTFPVDDSVRIKGANDAAERWAGVELYRLEAQGTPQPLAEVLGSKDSLLVAYRNGGKQPFTHLLVFGVASTGQIYWYYPAWQSPEDAPSAIAIEASEGPVELHERISHDLPRGRFVVHAVFARRALRVSDVERLVTQADPLTPLPLPETAQQRQVVEVF